MQPSAARGLSGRDLIAASIVLTAVAAELLLREQYYRLAVEMPRLLFVFGAWIATMVIGGAVARRAAPGRARAVGRVAVLVALGLWINVVGHAGGGLVIGGNQAARLLMALAPIGVLAGAWYAVRAGEVRWGRLRRGICGMCLFFVASQPVISAMSSDELSWPERGLAAPRMVHDGDGPIVTIFLLLDELNAKSAGPIAEALASPGVVVRTKALEPVGDATGKVIPSMFTGKRFDDAKPCGIDTVCSGSHVLDFSKVFASRPDVDVVGFYEPYCSIQGLRYCVRSSPDSPTFDMERWWCALIRRVAWLNASAGAQGASRCAELGGSVWDGLVSRVEESLWKAPVWQKGGFLYVHLPLPHPPGHSGDGTLPEHYQDNLLRAARIVERVARQARALGWSRIAVFSDHPLRGHLWCASSQYRDKGCPLNERLVDDKVPLLMSGDIPSNFDAVENNGEIFMLAQ